MHKLDLEIKYIKIVVDLQNEPRLIFILCKGKFESFWTMVTLEFFIIRKSTKGLIHSTFTKNYGKRFVGNEIAAKFRAESSRVASSSFRFDQSLCAFLSLFLFQANERPKPAHNSEIKKKCEKLIKILAHYIFANFYSY